MSTYVLVHGAWHGNWCWKRVRRALQADGHEVFTPTLTGLGERSHLLTPQVDLETHIIDVINCILWEELSDVILCGHSYAGAVIRAAADRIPDRISALVYLDAFVPENGQTVYDTVPVAMRDLQIELAQKLGDGWKVPPVPAEAFGVNAVDREWVDRRCTFQPIAGFQQALNLTGAHARVNPVYIFSDGYQPTPFAIFYEKAKADGWKTHTVTCGHDVMLDKPEQLTQILLSI